VDKKTSWKIEFSRELERAMLANSSGKIGMARVCARRAAGIVIGEYLRRQGFGGSTKSAYNNLSIFINLPDVDDRYKEICSHFLMKVNQDHMLPVDADLIHDATLLKHSLLYDHKG
jgi:hypothetical protein